MNVKTQIRLENIKIEAIKARIMVFKNMAVTKRLPGLLTLIFITKCISKKFLINISLHIKIKLFYKLTEANENLC